MLRTLVALFCLIWAPAFAQDRVRVASFNVGLGRDGPGLLLKDIQSRDADIVALANIIAKTAPDILLITDFDGDYRNLAAQAFIDLLASETGQDYPYFFATIGNSGQPSGFDLNGNGRLDDWADNWGFGLFPRQGSMLLLSKYPIDQADSRTYSEYLWQDLPNAPAPKNLDQSDFLSAEAWQNMRLASKNFWDIAIDLPGRLGFRILASHATPPVFDGDENLNGLRNDAEIGFWANYLDQGRFERDFVILADFNADPKDGQGLGFSLDALLNHPNITDPLPSSSGAMRASVVQAGINLSQTGNPATDTADWPDEEIGNLRVDYVLPASGLNVLDAGVFWPEPDDPLFSLLKTANTAHRLVWVDIELR